MTTTAQYVNPEIARRVARLDLKAKFIVEGFLAGLHDSPYQGFSLEFSEYRNYVPGDDPKSLDWAVWAKTDRLFVKTFQAETNLDAYLLVDTSRSMAFSGVKGAMTKLEYATALAAALGYLLTSQRDSVGLGILGSGLERFLPPHATRRQLVRILAELANAKSGGATRLAAGLHAVAQRVRRRGLMVLLSDLLDEPEQVLQAMRHLVFRGHDVVVFQILDAAERHLAISGPVVLADPETGAEVATDGDAIRQSYTERIEAFVGRYEREVRDMGGEFAAMTTSTPFDHALVRFLAERKRRF
jgi:uncharacterized protein (DUF58 family)